MTRLVKGYNLRGKKGIKINFGESYESKTHFLISYFHVTVHFPHTIHILVHVQFLKMHHRDELIFLSLFTDPENGRK